MVAFVLRNPSATLLATQVGALLVYPFLDDSHLGRSLVSALGILILGLVVLTVRSSPSANWFVFALGVPASVLLVIQAITGNDDLFPYSSALEAILYFYAALALVRYMLADSVITRDELWAVGATFTLLAWAFAYAYGVCQAIEPGTFTAIDPAGDRTWTELLLLSVTTLTSVGLGDVIPVKPFGRSLVMLEQMVGIGYVALVVSRLVGLMLFRGGEPAPRDSQEP